MSEASSKKHLVFVVGATATGKSDFAVLACEKIAEKFKATERPANPEIINCDSVQFFAGVEIGAAKPSLDLLKRVPHHLIGHVELGAEYTAGDFRRDALKVIEREQGDGLYFAVGGSGFYVQALEKGMYDVPPIPVEVRLQLEEEARSNLLGLHRELSERDPESAKKIQPADRYRIIRALEILRHMGHGQTLSEIRASFEKERPPAPFTNSKIGLFVPRDVLRERVRLRVQKMLAQGLIDEVKQLRDQGLKSWAPLQSVGYKETQSYLDGELSLNELEGAIETSTMQLAKRQMTWFKRDPEIRWFDVSQGYKEALDWASDQALENALST